MKYIASVSFGKDSLAMLLMLIEKQYPLDEVVFYDTGKEFQAIYNLRDKIKPLLESKNIKFTRLEPEQPFDYMMFEKPICKQGQKKSCNICLYCKDVSTTISQCQNPKSEYYQEYDDSGNMPWNIGCDMWDSGEKYGYGWCGGVCRWGTTYKISALDKIGDIKNDVRYVGIAVDESMRLEKERTGNKIFPLAEWDMTERDCLEYCYSQGYNWNENGVELYSVLDRVSCWCCRNKNLKELKGIYRYLPEYWQRLKDIQSRLPAPMKPSGSVFELEKRFERELRQLEFGA